MYDTLDCPIERNHGPVGVSRAIISAKGLFSFVLGRWRMSLASRRIETLFADTNSSLEGLETRGFLNQGCLVALYSVITVRTSPHPSITGLGQ